MVILEIGHFSGHLLDEKIDSNADIVEYQARGNFGCKFGEVKSLLRSSTEVLPPAPSLLGRSTILFLHLLSLYR